ncbi:T-lymphocyte activation antigen CD80-like [Cetorhinus maximus]
MLPCNTSRAGMQGSTVYWQSRNRVVLYWKKGTESLQYQHVRYRNRTHIDSSEFLMGNLSLTLGKLRLEDTGDYECIVRKEQDITPDKYTITLIVNISAVVPRIPSPMGLDNITKTNGTGTEMRERHHYFLILFAIIIGILLINFLIWRLRRR